MLNLDYLDLTNQCREKEWYTQTVLRLSKIEITVGESSVAEWSKGLERK